MPALTGPQLALLRSQPQTSEWWIHPLVPPTVFAAQINDGSITVGARTITYDHVTTGAYTDVVAGMTLWVGTAPDTYNVARIRVRSATAAHLVVAENSDVAWADNYYLTVKREWLCWSIRPFINSSGVVFKDYDIAWAGQTTHWPPVAMMGDPVCKPFAGNPTPVYFDGSESYATSPAATITSYLWDFGDGTTSSAATPGNHNYTCAGDRWASLTVTDTNGQTCVTYRPISLPDPATLYTARFEQQSLDAAIDGGWTGKCTVFAPNADISGFPERAPCFVISADTFGGTAGSVGYPRGRENVVLFGYIQDNSVQETPEDSEIEFTVESVDKVAGRAAAITTFVADASSPANWDEGVSLNIFRSFVYLLAFQSTLFQIADVKLYNDTTPLKIARFPEDSLWNMFAQFAKGARLMRVGVTRTGRVIVARDPNLLPVASRGSVVTVCQLQDGDWTETVTIPQLPFPSTSFLCLSGVSYDGTPAHDPLPLFGMSPGHPPKEYGASREIHDLALVNQSEANTVAGLAVGQDNNDYGDVNIPLWGNWIGAFDPAYQEYVQAPAGGFDTHRGVLLAGALLIVRKVSIGFDWEAGAMRSTLTCEVYTYPDIGVTGDCYTTDAPAPPPPTTPPIVPPPPPVGNLNAPYFCFDGSYCDTGEDVAEVDWCFTDGSYYAAYVAGYLYRSTAGPSGPFTLIYTDTGSNFYYVDRTVVPGNSYWYKVRANISGSLTPFSTVQQVDVTLDCAPVLAGSSNCLTMSLSWTAVDGAASYHIERSLSAGSGYSEIAVVATLIYGDTPTPADHYYYRVRASVGALYSPYSNVVSGDAGVGTLAFPAHVLFATAAQVWESTNFNGANFCQPDWTDVTANAPSGGPMVVDDSGGTPIYYLLANDGNIYKRIGSGTFEVYIDLATWTLAAAAAGKAWQSSYDPNHAFPGCDGSVHYSPHASTGFLGFVGQKVYFLTSPGSTVPSCGGDLPYPGMYYFDISDTTGTVVSATFNEANNFLGLVWGPHFASRWDEPGFIGEGINHIGSFDGRFYSDTTEEYSVYPGGLLFYSVGDTGAAGEVWLWEGGNLYHSSDYGATRTLYSGEDASPNSMGVYLGQVVGSAASIIRVARDGTFNTNKSTDGGSSWTAISGSSPNGGSMASGGVSNAGIYMPIGYADRLFLINRRYNNRQILVSDEDGERWFKKTSTITFPGTTDDAIQFLWADASSVP